MNLMLAVQRVHSIPFDCHMKKHSESADDVRKHINDLNDAGIISESGTPCVSPIVVVRKKNGTIHMCVDYRTLNRRTVPDQCTVPHLEDALSCLSGSQWFSVLDLGRGYYHIPLRKGLHLPSQVLSV